MPDNVVSEHIEEYVKYMHWWNGLSRSQQLNQMRGWSEIDMLYHDYAKSEVHKANNDSRVD